jgi:hypothetical protein
MAQALRRRLASAASAAGGGARRLILYPAGPDGRYTFKVVAMPRVPNEATIMLHESSLQRGSQLSTLLSRLSKLDDELGAARIFVGKDERDPSAPLSSILGQANVALVTPSSRRQLLNDGARLGVTGGNQRDFLSQSIRYMYAGLPIAGVAVLLLLQNYTADVTAKRPLLPGYVPPQPEQQPQQRPQQPPQR